jgi:hypothetical protein
MENVYPLTREIKDHLAELTASPASPASPEGLADEVRTLLRSIDARRARGWHKVPYRELAVLRALVGVPEPENPYSEIP